MTPPAVPSGRYRFGAFVLDTTERTLLHDGHPVPLRARPFDVLAVLVENAGRLVTKDELLDRVWSKLVVEDNNLQVHVATLRKVLGRDAIATVPGRGYRFARHLDGDVAEQKRTDESAAPSPRRPSALPEIPSTLIGRDDDIRQVTALLRQHRLVTVTGPGGIGKTRLAQAVGRAAARAGDPVAWVDLSQLSDPALVASHVAAALAVDVPAGEAPLEVLVQSLCSASTLVVIDNAEHVLGAMGELATALLVGTRGIRLVVTSQAPLRLSPEQVYRLAALACPASCESLTAASAMTFGAIAFFVERMHGADRRFVLDDANARVVCEICRRLDGVPLALELAAARGPLLGLDQVAARLDERFRLLSRGTRDAPTRQQTLSAVFEWSHQLLTPDEQRVFRRLAPMVGSFALEDACAVASVGDEGPALDEWSVIDHLGALVERSLVAVDADDPPRYRLLETARAYALDKLRAADDQSAVRRASRMYEDAGDAATLASRSTEALRRYSAALEAASLLPGPGERAARELDICLKLGPAVQTVLGPAHPRCEEIYRRAVDLARGLEADERAFKALWGYWHFLCMAGRDREAAPYADEIVAMGRTLRDDGLELEACHAALTTQQLLGNAPALVANAERALALYDRERHHHLTFAFGGHDPGICASGQGAVGLWLTGRCERAVRMADDALAMGARVEHGYSRAVAFYYTAMMFAASGSRERFRASAEALVALSQQHGMEMLGTEGRFFIGCADWQTGNRETGLAAMRDTLATIEASGDLAFALFYIALFAAALIDAGKDDEVGHALERGFAYAAAGQGFFLPELHRLRGAMAAKRGDRSAAIVEWTAARDVADRQGAAMLALRAATDLARVDGSVDRMADLERRLTMIVACDDVPEVRAARAVIGADQVRP